MPPVRVVYSDLDGTMVGPGGCFFRTIDKSLTLEPSRALVDLLTAGVVLVLVSGRTRPQLVEACRIFGADGYVGELGSVLGWESARRSEVLRGAMPDEYDAVPAAVIAKLGVVEGLFARYPGLLEFHSPWHEDHEGDVMLRGVIDVADAEAWLDAQGWGWLKLHDNGVLPDRRPTGLRPEARPAHVYHLMPDGLSKGLAVARDLTRRGLSADEAIAIGDSASDLTMAGHVGRMFVPSNALRHPEMETLVGVHANAVVTDDAVGLGWVQAVRWALGQR